MSADATVSSPEPAVCPIVVVAPPQMPVGPHTAPMPLIVAVEGPVAVQVDSDAPVTTPRPSSSTMKPMVVTVALVQMPVSTHAYPLCSSPALVNAQAIQMTPNPSELTPEPPRPFVIMITTPQMPVGSHIPPMTLMITVELPSAVQVHTNASIPAPTPLGATMEAVVVMIAAVQLPESSNDHPLCTSPSPLDAHAVQVASDSAISAPRPSFGL